MCIRDRGKPEEASSNAKTEGIKIYTVGIGAPTGVPIPAFDKNGVQIGVRKDRQGNIVTTRLDEETLQRIAMETGGKYYPARPGSAELKAITSAIAGMEKKELQAKKFSHYEDRFQIPLAVALLCMLAAYLLPERRKITGTLSDYVQTEERL